MLPHDHSRAAGIDPTARVGLDWVLDPEVGSDICYAKPLGIAIADVADSFVGTLACPYSIDRDR